MEGAGTRVVVDGFADLREIGRGGFATVYSAVDATGAVVALKVFAASDVDRRRVRRELVALERLVGIPGVVPVLDVATSADGSPVMIMPFLPTTMAQLTAPDGVGADVAVGWLIELGTALDSAAALDVHHRDVKPGNVLIDEDGHAHLADFGISALAEMDTGTTTATAFSPPYAAPERLEGRNDIDQMRSDVYSLAATTWAAIVGGAPFGTATTGGVSGLITRVMTNQLERPPTMSPALYEVLRTGMALDPSARYSSASALAAAARQALEASEDATVARIPAAGGADADADADDPRLIRRRRAARVTAAAAAVALVLVGAVAAIAATRSDGQELTISRASDERPTSIDSTPEPGLDVASATTVVEPSSVESPSDPAMTGETTTVAPSAGGPATSGSPATSGGTTVGAAGTATTAAPKPTGSSNGAAPAQVTTTTSPPAVPASCRIINGKVDLSPGIAWGEVAAQNATLVAPMTCQLSRGGNLSASMLLRVSFAALGYTGGQGDGSGSISWANGQSTQVISRVAVNPTGDNENYDVVLTMTFPSGFGASASGTTNQMRVAGVFDPAVARIVSITGMNGTFTWVR